MSHFYLNLIVISLLLHSLLLISANRPQDLEDIPEYVTLESVPLSNISKSIPFALSPVYLIELAVAEQTLYDEVKKYSNSLKDGLQLAEAYLEDYEQSTDTSGYNSRSRLAKATEVASNPLMSYRMIRRFTKEFKSFETWLEINLGTKFEDKLAELKATTPFPTDEEQTDDALRALLRLQHFYDLSSDDIAKGKIHKNQTKVGLKTVHSLEIAEFALKNEFYYLANEWLKTAGRQLVNESQIHTFGTDFENVRQRLYKEHDESFNENLNSLHPYMFIQKLGENSNPKTLKEILTKKYKGMRNLKTSRPGLYEYNFMALCNGEETMTLKKKSKLFCWLETRNNPYFLISPLKMEFLHQNPDLVQIYDVATDEWIRDIINAGTKLLKPAPSFPPRYRSAMYGWLADEEISNTPLSRRIELIFNLKTVGFEASDYLQVAAYSYGGFIGMHFDFMGEVAFGRNEKDNNTNYLVNPAIAIKGDRMATFLLYLNDVEEGGHTAFLELGTFAKPVKGSAVFWYAALKNGAADENFLHGACPVIFGHKWIATKWTHQFENFLKRPCALDPNI